MMGGYTLVDRKAVPVSIEECMTNPLTAEQRRVGDTRIGGVRVSTVFLVLDHGFGSDVPILFESMAFNLPGELHLETRCTTWEEAELMHEAMCKKVRELPETP